MAETDTERTSVKTYVPAYQKETWADHADELDMSLSEFVRSMVQAGRRGFEESVSEGAVEGDDSQSGEEPGSPDADPGGSTYETVVLEALSEEALEFDELVERSLEDVRASVQEDVRDALQSLQAENRVTHDPLEGGYTVIDGD